YRTSTPAPGKNLQKAAQCHPLSGFRRRLPEIVSSLSCPSPTQAEAERPRPVPAEARVRRLSSLPDGPAPLLLPSGTIRRTLAGDSRSAAATLESAASNLLSAPA